jgi:tetratricopeptide (TPR) repeat protein
MKKALLFFFIITSVYFSVKAQDFVTYSGNTERSLINSAQTPDDFIKLSLTSELNDDEYQVIYNKFIQDLKQLNLGSDADKSEKHVRKVYQVIHDHFLKNYNPQAHFGDFIVNGDYQCVSASILYAYVLETLKIPYQIKQEFSHVYVIANPGTDNIQFETIDHLKLYYYFDDQAKQRNVNELIKAGYIDQSRAINVGTEQAFDDFFYSKTDISLKEAVGLLYFYRALTMMGGDATKEAYSDICKSDLLFPDRKNEFIKNNLLSSMITTFKYDDLEDWHALTHLVNNKYASDDVKKYLVFQFQNFTNNKLINAGQKDKVNEVFNYLRTSIIDTAVKRQVAETYFFDNAHYSYMMNDYSQALACLETAYSLNRNSPLITSDFVQMILHKYSGQATTAQNLGIFDKYMDGYPALKSNRAIISIYIYYMSSLCVTAFVTENGPAGEKYIQLLMHELDEHPDYDNSSHYVIGNAFARASMYYFKKQGKQKAVAVLNTGLKYAPDDEQLLRKLQADK